MSKGLENIIRCMAGKGEAKTRETRKGGWMTVRKSTECCAIIYESN